MGADGVAVGGGGASFVGGGAFGRGGFAVAGFDEGVFSAVLFAGEGDFNYRGFSEACLGLHDFEADFGSVGEGEDGVAFLRG